jgi:Post-segregation antitoxin CcdA
MNAETSACQATKWLEENAGALAEHRAWVETYGTFGDRVRAWKQDQTLNDAQPQFEDTNDNE